MSKNRLFVVSFLLVFAMFLAACGGGETVVETVEVEVTRIVEVEVAGEAAAAEPMTFEGGGDTLAAVQDRGILNCGVSGSLLAFSFPDEAGEMQGFDADYCRAVAAAALGDANAVEFRSSNASERFPILQSGEIDVLIRNTTWTVSRDTSLGFNFAPTTFYDGQGMIVRKADNITTLEDLDGGTVCVNAGTTTEKNLADVFRARGIDYEAVVFAATEDVRQAYDDGRCDGWTTDKSGLIANSELLAVPADHVILEDTMSKEPLGPLTRHGDDNWFDIVKWTVNCTIQAEELGITSENADSFLGGDDPVVQNLFGETGDLPQAMGLNNDFCYQIVKQVGNYGEIYDRALGPDTPYNLARGVNALWTDGGLMYAPPFR
ncbi:MAG: amino acid ABC transporter substrate-binding protein [Chloroflexi bacterium]|nr:MAG: amino acid ABC transporter substrate-binding protein [Chloroflexota bacterium]